MGDVPHMENSQVPPEEMEVEGGNRDSWDGNWEQLEERLKFLEGRQVTLSEMLNLHVEMVRNERKLHERFFQDIVGRFQSTEEQIEVITGQITSIQMDIDEQTDFAPCIQNLEGSVVQQDQILAEMHQKFSHDENEKRRELLGVKRQVLSLGNASQYYTIMVMAWIPGCIQWPGVEIPNFPKFQRSDLCRLLEPLEG